MLTKTMLNYLNSEAFKNPKTQSQKFKKTAYLKRVNRQIDRQLKMALWLANNHPNVFLNKPYKSEYGKERNRKGIMTGAQRIRTLMLIINNVSSNCDTQLVLKNIKMEDVHNAQNLR